MSVLTTAKTYRDSGFAVIPIRLDGSKAPSVTGWLNGAMPNDATLNSWFANQAYGIGIRCGAASGNLLVIDFDHDATTKFQQWLGLVAQEFPNIASDIAVVETPRPGVHVYLRSTEPVGGSRKLATRDVGQSVVTLIETAVTGLNALRRAHR